MRDRLKVLFLAPDPFRDRAPLRLNEEVRAIGHALRGGSERDALGMGWTVQASFGLAVNQFELEGRPEATAPVLRIRPGVDPAVPLVAPAGGEPFPSPATAANPAGARQVNVFERFHGDDTLFEAGPGSGNGEQEKRFGDVSGNRFTFRAGGSR